MDELAKLGELAQLEQLEKLAELVSESFPADGGSLDWLGKLELLVLQPTPFCNLDCDYCYLPHRDDRRKMDFAVLDALAWKIFNGGLSEHTLSVVWHAGEPLVVPSGWYEQAFSILERHNRGRVAVAHNIQTNGVLIDHTWCEFFKRKEVRLGVSIDGPHWLHDRHRKTRNGTGTHQSVMRGIEALQRNDVPFHVICVLTLDALAYPDEILDFFEGLAPTYLCFNIDEIEANNATSTLLGSPSNQAATESAFRAFFTCIVARMRSNDLPFRIREIDNVLAALRHPRFGSLHSNSQNEPGRILTITRDGGIYTFSPELAGVTHPKLGTLALGNVLFDPLIPLNSRPFDRQAAEIAAGVECCRRECKYFDLCLGGAPSNKLGETGRFDSAETRFCRLVQKVIADVVLDALDKDLPASKG